MNKNKWKDTIFDDVVRLKRGYDLPNHNIVAGPYPVVTSSNVKARHNEYKVKPPGVVTGRSGTLGIVQYVKEKFWPLNTALYAKDFRDNDPKFVYYFLQVMKLENFNAGAGVPTLNQNHLHKVPVLLPPKEQQKKVAAILSVYDDLIENNNNRIALLKEMAEEIYREWFVRMRFPGYEKAKFEKGMPADWRIDRVDNIGKVITGKTPSTDNLKYYGGGIPFIKTPDMHGNMFVYSTEETLTIDGLNSQPSQIIPKDSISVSCIGTGGVTSLTTKRCSTNQQINSIVLKDINNLEWAFFTIKNLEETIKMFGSTGTTMTNLSKGKFSSIKILIPIKELRIKYHRETEPVFSKIKLLIQSNMKLVKSREMLLAWLISGKLSVKGLDVQFPPNMQEEAEFEKEAFSA